MKSPTITIRTALVIWLLSATLGSANAGADSNANRWIIGTWELAYDPDSDPKDWLIFEEGQQITVRSPTGELTRGIYQVNDDVVILFVIAGSRPLQIPMSVSADRERLNNSSGAYYTKVSER